MAKSSSTEGRVRVLVVEDEESFIDALSIGLDREGFTLCEAPSRVRRFDDEDEVRRIYHAECAALALQRTGGRRALVFDHLLRRREPGRPTLTLGRPGDGCQAGRSACGSSSARMAPKSHVAAPACLLTTA